MALVFGPHVAGALARIDLRVAFAFFAVQRWAWRHSVPRHAADRIAAIWMTAARSADPAGPAFDAARAAARAVFTPERRAA